MLSIEQCRAARGLLGWTQQDLADVCGLSKTAINNFEKGYSDIKMESLRAIRMAFESANIEFLPGDGLRRKAENVQILRGPSAFAELLQDIVLSLKSGGEVLMSHVDASVMGKLAPKQVLEHLERMKNHNITERIICAEGTSSILGPASSCRWLKKGMAKTAMASFIYDHKVAFELWGGGMIVVIESREASNAERARFESLWASAMAADDMHHGAESQKS